MSTAAAGRRPTREYYDWPEDILRCVIDQVHSNRTLANLACTSRLFSTVALDKLWHTIPDLVVLARCMNSEHWEEPEVIASDWFGYGRHEQRVYTSEIVLSARERSGDWPDERFRQYAARINSVDINQERRVIHPSVPKTKSRTPYLITTVHLDVLVAWSSHSQSGQPPLFPHLKHLTVRTLNNPQDMSMRASCFLLPSVVSVHLMYYEQYDTQERLPAIVYEAFARCSSMYTLEFSGTALESLSFDDLIDCSLGQLRELRVRFDDFTMSQNMANHLAASPHLEVAPAMGHLQRMNASPKSFPALRALSIRIRTVHQLRDTLGSVHSASLHSLAIHVGDEIGTPQEVTKVLHLVADHPSAPALRTLSITFNQSYWDLPEYYGSPSDIDVLKPILKFSGLRRVEVRTARNTYFEMNDTDLRRTLHAWPQLERLSIQPLPSYPVFSLNVFVNLLLENPSLICAPLSVTCMLDETVPITTGFRHCDLQGISFRVMLGEADETVDRVPLAHYLISTFPRLHESYFDSDNKENCHIEGDEETGLLVKKARMAHDQSGNIWTLDDFNTLARSKVMYRFEYRRPLTANTHKLSPDLFRRTGALDCLTPGDGESEDPEVSMLSLIFS